MKLKSIGLLLFYSLLFALIVLNGHGLIGSMGGNWGRILLLKTLPPEPLHTVTQHPLYTVGMRIAADDASPAEWHTPEFLSSAITQKFVYTWKATGNLSDAQWLSRVWLLQGEATAVQTLASQNDIPAASGLWREVAYAQYQVGDAQGAASIYEKLNSRSSAHFYTATLLNNWQTCTNTPCRANWLAHLQKISPNFPLVWAETWPQHDREILWEAQWDYAEPTLQMWLAQISHTLWSQNRITPNDMEELLWAWLDNGQEGAITQFLATTPNFPSHPMWQTRLIEPEKSNTLSLIDVSLGLSALLAHACGENNAVFVRENDLLTADETRINEWSWATRHTYPYALGQYQMGLSDYGGVNHPVLHLHGLAVAMQQEGESPNWGAVAPQRQLWLKPNGVYVFSFAHRTRLTDGWMMSSAHMFPQHHNWLPDTGGEWQWYGFVIPAHTLESLAFAPTFRLYQSAGSLFLSQLEVQEIIVSDPSQCQLVGEPLLPVGETHE